MLWSNIHKLWKMDNPPHFVFHLNVYYCHQERILRPRIIFRFKTIYIDNQSGQYSIICANGSSMLEGVCFTTSYTPVISIKLIWIIIAIAPAEVLMIYFLDISNASQNTILPNTEESVYPSLPPLYLCWSKRKCPNIHEHQEIQDNSSFKILNKHRKKTSWKFLAWPT